MGPTADGRRTPDRHTLLAKNDDLVLARHRDDEDAAARRSARWGALPPRVKPEDMVEEIPASSPADPEAGRNPDRDWMLRYSG
jgi:hypothetical protein